MTVSLDIRDDDGKARPMRVVLTRPQIAALIRHLRGPKGSKPLARAVREIGRRVGPGRSVTLKVLA